MTKKEVFKDDRKNRAAKVCGITGTVLLTVLVLLCIPLTLPRLFGWEIYSVVSGSMEPAVPVGSIVYVKPNAPEDVGEKEIIAFYGARDSSAIITHRVVENRVVMGEFITKGDANQTNDMNPVPYSDFIGKVVLSVPWFGFAAQIFTSTVGKITAAAFILLAVFLEIIASAVEKRNHITYDHKEK